MAQTASEYRPTSQYQTNSQFRATSDYVISPGLTPPAANTPSGSGQEARGATKNRHTGRGNAGGTAQAGLGDISLKVRLIAAFALVGFAAISVSLITGLQLDGVRAALPESLSAAERAPIRDAIAGVRSISYIAGAVTAVIAVIAGVVLSLSIANPVQRITHAMSALAKGDTNVAIPVARNADEIGVMAGTIATFKENMLEIQRLTREREEEERRQEAERQAMRERMGAKLEESVSSIVETAREDVATLRRLSSEMLDAQRTANQQTDDVTDAAKRASEIAASFSHAVDDLSNAITDIEQRIEQTSEMSDQAAQDARETDTDITALVKAADSITEIIDLINDIAGKTNMLALNAAVEAVRAGEAGKSFQVVAREIKSLSNQTADATKRVEGHIADIRTKTDHTAKRVRGILEVVGMISTAASDIQGAVEQQSRTAAQISTDAREASSQTQVMQNGVETVSTQTAATEKAAEQVRDGAENVGERVNAIREQVDSFLENAVKNDDGQTA